MNESSIKGVSIRGWLALIIVVSGLGFLYLLSFAALIFVPMDDAIKIVLMVVATVSGVIGAATGFYFGQKSTETNEPPTE